MIDQENLITRDNYKSVKLFTFYGLCRELEILKNEKDQQYLNLTEQLRRS